MTMRRALMPRAAGFFSSLLTASALVSASAPAAAMAIFIDPVAGLSLIEPTWDFTRLQLDVEPSDSIENVMAKIADQDMDIMTERQLLFFGIQQLDQARTLADYNIQKEAVLVLASTAPLPAQVVPEPTTPLLTILGGLGLALIRRKARQSRPASASQVLDR